MTEGLFWPGDGRAGSVLTADSYVAAMVAVEDAWLQALVDTGVAPISAKAELTGLVGVNDVDDLAAASEAGGNPVIPLVALLRRRVQGADDSDAARWIHRGLTSQDVVDTALVLGVRDALDRVHSELRAQIALLVALADTHRASVMAGRTLTQYAVPITFGVKVAGWLTGVLDAAVDVAAARSGLAVQVGGAAGTLSAATELARSAGLHRPDRVAVALGECVAAALELPYRPPWPTSRRSFTRAADALVAACDAWGHLASDVSVLGRPEVGELAESVGPGRGGSSTMPQKQNPVLTVLVRRAAIAAPTLAATLHVAAGLTVDERSDGAWHAEWAPLRTLARVAVVAGSQTTELLTGLRVETGQMRDRAVAQEDSLLTEQAAIAGEATLVDDYLGASGWVVDEVVDRAHAFLAG